MKFGQVANCKKGNNIDMQNRNMLNFDFLGKGLEIVSPSHLTMIFFQKKISHVMLF